MTQKSVIDIWNKGNEKLFGNQKVTKEMITHALDQKTQKTLRHFNFNLIFYWVIQVINLCMISMNIVGYNGNNTMLWILGMQLAITLFVMYYGIHIYLKHRDINNLSKDLKTLIDKQLNFYRTSFEIWLLLITFTVLILIFNLNIMVDNMDGHYPINNVALFIEVNIGIFIFIYASQKVASLWAYRSLKANLIDLKTGMLDRSFKMEESRKKWIWFWVLLAIILLIVFIAGIIKAIQF